MATIGDLKEKKRKAKQKRQGSLGSKSITTGNPNIYKGIATPPSEQEETLKGLQTGLGSQFKSKRMPGVQPPTAELGGTQGKLYPEVTKFEPTPGELTPTPRDIRPSSVTAPSGGLVVKPTQPGAMSWEEMGEGIYKTTPRHPEDISRLGRAVYSRRPGDLEDITQPTTPGIGGIPSRRATDARVPAPTTEPKIGGIVKGRSEAERYAGGDVFSYGAVGQTYRRLGQQRNQLNVALARGKISPRRHADALAELSKEEEGYRGMALEEQKTQAGQATALGDQMRASVAKAKDLTDRLKHETLSAKDKATLQKDLYKSEIDTGFKYYNLAQNSKLGATTFNTMFNKAMETAKSPEDAVATIGRIMGNNPDLYNEALQGGIKEAELTRLLDEQEALKSQ